MGGRVLTMHRLREILAKQPASIRVHSKPVLAARLWLRATRSWRSESVPRFSGSRGSITAVNGEKPRKVTLVAVCRCARYLENRIVNPLTAKVSRDLSWIFACRTRLLHSLPAVQAHVPSRSILTKDTTTHSPNRHLLPSRKGRVVETVAQRSSFIGDDA